MKKILTICLFLIFPLAGHAQGEDPKYKRGDCITPVTESYSWFGKYALVEAYSSIEGFGNKKSYILAFPFHGSRSAIFSKEIEAVTKKVSLDLCGS